MAQGPTSWDSWALEHRVKSCVSGLSCSAARGIFLAQGSNPCLLHWQADSLPPWKPSPGLHMSTLLRERQNMNLVQAIVILEFLSYLFKAWGKRLKKKCFLF